MCPLELIIDILILKVFLIIQKVLVHLCSFFLASLVSILLCRWLYYG